MAPLDPDHEEHVREIANNAVRRFARTLLDEIAALPARADGNLNGLDAYKAIERATIRFETE
jgi:hypothetical protein